MDLSAYLSRIHYSGPPEPREGNLRSLHRAHVYQVPFENLDIGLGRPIHLEDEALFDKIVRRQRGGFCYELNGLFRRLLEGLGYSVTLLSARPVNDDGSFCPEFDHLALLVTTPLAPMERWLVDVGWGDGFLEPLRLDDPAPQVIDGRPFRVGPAGDGWQVEEQKTDGSWLHHYHFRLTPRRFEEFFDMCRYHQTNPESMFTQKRLCTRFTPDGRVTLSERKLIITHYTGGPRGSETREEHELPDEDAVRRALVDWFGVDLAV